MTTLIGQTVGGFRILERIGRGGMATVYKAYQPSLDRYVAIKVLPLALTEEPDFAERFQREARLVARLEHPHILPVHDFGREGDLFYIAMRYVNAGTLKELMGQPLPLDQIVDLIAQIADALDCAHRQGVVHRDVKPSNILLDRGQWALLTDFGLARMMEPTTQITATGVGVGTPDYMSPEQGLGERVDERTDLYSLGVVLYEMLTGRVPFQAETPMAVVLKHIHEPLPKPRAVNPGIPEAVEGVVLRALAKRREERYASAAEMARELRNAVEEARHVRAPSKTMPPGPPAVVASAPASKPAVSLGGLRWLPCAGALALMICLAGLGIWQVPGIVARLREARSTVTQTSVAIVPLPTASPLQPTILPSPTPLPAGARFPRGQIAFVTGDEGAWQILLVDPIRGESQPLPGQPPNSGVPAWSPDGTALAFRSDITGVWQIYVVGIDGRGLQQLTFGTAGSYEPAWSPDGTQIAYVSEQDGDKEIYVMNRDGTGARRLTFNPGWDDDPSWSPDGRWLVYESQQGGRMDIYRLGLDGSGPTRLTTEGEANSTPAWSPDGRSIGFERDTGDAYHIWIMFADGSGQRQLTTDGGWNLRPTWSPDGIEIAYTSNRSGEEAIWIRSATGDGAPRRLTSEGGYDAAWSRSADAWPACPGAQPSRIARGMRVYVAYDPPLRNRVRAAAGTNATTIGYMDPGGEAVILDGPGCADGWVWWQVRLDNGLSGWTAEGDGDVYWLVPLRAAPSSATTYDEAQVRYILADSQLGSVIGYYRARADQPAIAEAVRRWDAGVRVVNIDDFERIIVGTWVVVYRGTRTQIDGMDVLLTSD
jgi:Tol biopolymer transport system component